MKKTLKRPIEKMLLYHVFMGMCFFFATCQGDKSRFHMWNEIVAPLLYLGDTPYQNQPFDSANISTALRIQRDLAMNVTIDQLVWPALDLSTAFFGNNYSTQRASELDQPLLMGYKRLIVDIYWDPIRLDWQLCPVPIVTNTSSSSNVTINGYTCAPNFLFQDFMNAVNDYLVSTETERAPKVTSLVTIILNLHELPSSTNTTTAVTKTNLGEIIHRSISKNVNLESRIYTPSNLTVDRINVSASFYAHGLEPYFPLYQQNLASSSPWPQWLYLIEKKVQLLVGFGTIEQNTNNTSTFTISPADKSIIFDAISLGGAGGGMNLSVNSKIEIPPQCTLEPLSWSFVNDNRTKYTYDTALQVTQCGYSPYFTHSNYSNDQSKYTEIDGGHLADNVLSTIWSWEVNEPNPTDGKRCAAIKGDNGRWVAYDCAETLRVACRLATNPNQWVLTKNSVIYDRALSACPQNYIFDIPRIPRQNINLRQAMMAQNLTDAKVWLNLNLLYNDDSCWVIGRYGTCWWSAESGDEFLGLIQTSIVAGVIVLLLVGIFTWVKCARLWRNRNSKSRKAMVKAMLTRREYVTVPA